MRLFGTIGGDSNNRRAAWMTMPFDGSQSIQYDVKQTPNRGGSSYLRNRAREILYNSKKTDSQSYSRP